MGEVDRNAGSALGGDGRRLDKYSKYIALLSGSLGAVTTVVKGWETASFAFVGLAALSLGYFFARWVVSALGEEGSKDYRLAAMGVAGLLLVAGGVGWWGWWTVAKPAVMISRVHVDHDVALRTLLKDYGPVESGTMHVNQAVANWHRLDPSTREHVDTRLDEGITATPVRLEVAVETRSKKPVTVHEARVRVLNAAGLVSCIAYGELPTLGMLAFVELCPWWNGFPREVTAYTGSGVLTLDEPVQRIEILVSNAGCSWVPPRGGRLVVGLYEIQIEVEYGTTRRVVTSEPQLIAVPTLEYYVGGLGEIWYERRQQPPVEALTDCRAENSQRAKTLLESVERLETDGWVLDELLPAFRAVQTRNTVSGP